MREYFDVIFLNQKILLAITKLREIKTRCIVLISFFKRSVIQGNVVVNGGTIKLNDFKLLVLSPDLSLPTIMNYEHFRYQLWKQVFLYMLAKFSLVKRINV